MRARLACLHGSGLLLAVLALGCLALGCSATTAPGPAPSAERAVDGCGPVGFDDVRGRAPSYVAERIDTFPNDDHLCAGLWITEAEDGFVPQGLAVSAGERTAWVSGYDAGPVGSRLCRVLVVDLRTGRTMAQRGPVSGSVGTRPEVVCRHGGGLLRDRHGLWLVETSRLWLLDPATLTTRRVWALAEPLKGSFAVHDADGLLGLGRFRTSGRAGVDWVDPAALVDDGEVEVGASSVLRSQRAPLLSQGAFHGDLGPGGSGVWFVRSVTRCGILQGPGGARGFLPGAEGGVLTGRGERRSLWTLSESATRGYQAEGGRPVVPMIARFEVGGADGVRRWERPGCSL